MHNLDYKGPDGFETKRDLIYGNHTYSAGTVAATYSPKERVGIFAFIAFEYIPESMQKYAKHYHPYPQRPE